MQGTFGGGARVSASVAYLQPVLGRSNLDVLVDTTVTKLTQTGTEDGEPVLRGVQFAQSSSGRSSFYRSAENARTDASFHEQHPSSR